MAGKTPTWSEAVEIVLRDAGEPLNYLKITEEIVDRKLRANPGVTPAYTVASTLTLDKGLGEKSRFVWVSRGVYGLREWQKTDGPAAAAEEEVQPEEAVKEIAVQAYGIFWEKELVDWAKSTPVLLGQQFENTTPVDFCEQRGIYVLYDHRDIVYAGRATARSLGLRLRDHAYDRLRSRWNRFSWFGFHSVTADGSLKPPVEASIDLERVIAILEAVVIELAEPPQNRQQGKGFGGIEYLQRPDPSLRKQRNRDMITLFSKVVEAGDEG